jgi:hypothetical protein
MGIKFNILVTCGLNCPRAVGHGAKKEVCFAYRILVLHFFSLFGFAHGSA